MNTKRLFNKVAQKTHMPFYHDGDVVFCVNENSVQRHFCRKNGQNVPSEYRPWKLAMTEWSRKTIRPIPVDMPDDAVLCNPTFYKKNNRILLSFIAGRPTENSLDYHLYQMSGPSWDALGEPRRVAGEHARTGFVSSRHCCLGNSGSLILFDRFKNEWQNLTTSLTRIARAIYDPANPARLLITGPDDTERYRTLSFDVDTNETLEIAGPAPVYKACLVESRIVFAYRESEDLEDYQLHIAPANFKPTEETVLLKAR